MNTETEKAYWDKRGNKKRCPKCSETKEISEFGVIKNYLCLSGSVHGYCKKCYLRVNKQWRDNNKKSVNKSRKEYREKNKEKLSRNNSDARRKIRMEVVEKYGGKCVCCGEGRYEFLAIDHINNDGKEHRKEVSGNMVPRWLKKNNYPEGFQILCHNCNMAKAFYGKCPHNPKDRMILVSDVEDAIEQGMRDCLFLSDLSQMENELKTSREREL